MKKFIATVATILFFLPAINSSAYILERANSGVSIFWDLTRNDAQVAGGAVVFHLNPNCSADYAVKADCLNTLRASFNNWESVAYSKIRFAEGSPTTTSVASNDGVNNVIFVTGDPELSGGILALTTTFFNTTTGAITDSDIRFNDGATDFYPGSSTNFLETVATHEIGHLFGLDHSFVAYIGMTLDPATVATMFPQAVTTEMRTLEPDDEAGASVIYPEATFATNFGSVTGMVDSAEGLILGAHVSMLDTTTGAPIVAAVSDKLGNYRIDGIPPGSYVALCEEPLDPAYLGPYYSLSATDYPPVLYLDHQLTGFDQAVPGAPAFDSAERVVVVAANTTSAIDFTVTQPTIPKPPIYNITEQDLPSRNMISRHLHQGEGGCAMSSTETGSITWLILAMVPAVRLITRRKRSLQK